MSGSPTTGINGSIWVDLTAGGTCVATAAGTVGTAAGTLTNIASKTGWTFDGGRDFIDVTGFGDSLSGGRRRVPSFSSNEGDIEGHMDMASSGTLLATRLFSATSERSLLIFPDITNYPSILIQGKAFFSHDAAGAIDSAVDLNMHFVPGPTGLAWSGI